MFEKVGTMSGLIVGFMLVISFFILMMAIAMWDVCFRCRHQWKVIRSGKIVSGVSVIGSYYDQGCTKCGKIRCVKVKV